MTMTERDWDKLLEIMLNLGLEAYLQHVYGLPVRLRDRQTKVWVGEGQ